MTEQEILGCLSPDELDHLECMINRSDVLEEGVGKETLLSYVTKAKEAIILRSVMEIPEEIKSCIQRSGLEKFSNQIKDLEDENGRLSNTLDAIEYVLSMNTYDDAEELARDINECFI